MLFLSHVRWHFASKIYFKILPASDEVTFYPPQSCCYLPLFVTYLNRTQNYPSCIFLYFFYAWGIHLYPPHPISKSAFIFLSRKRHSQPVIHDEPQVFLKYCYWFESIINRYSSQIFVSHLSRPIIYDLDVQCQLPDSSFSRFGRDCPIRFWFTCGELFTCFFFVFPSAATESVACFLRFRNIFPSAVLHPHSTWRCLFARSSPSVCKLIRAFA